jgi:hypothetical protein
MYPPPSLTTIFQKKNLRSSQIIVDHRGSSQIINHRRSSIIADHQSLQIINHRRSSAIIGQRWGYLGQFGQIRLTFWMKLLQLVFFAPVALQKTPQHILIFQNRRIVVASHLLGDHINLHMNFEKCNIIADHRRRCLVAARPGVKQNKCGPTRG